MEQKEMLFKKIQNGDENARQEFINGNLRLVLSVVKKFANRGEQADDLFQIGCIGLMKAIDNFDLSYGVKFSTYAVPLILGEVKRFIRDSNVVRITRSVRDNSYKILQFKDEYLTQYSKEPIKPGESGEIVVTYNGAGKFPGHFRKSITIRSNAKKEIVRLYIEGDMQGGK